jgi:hypothetical protein
MAHCGVPEGLLILSRHQAHFKMLDHTLSGINIDPKNVVVSPNTKVQVVVMRETIANQYFIWNSLGACLPLCPCPLLPASERMHSHCHEHERRPRAARGE